MDCLPLQENKEQIGKKQKGGDVIGSDCCL